MVRVEKLNMGAVGEVFDDFPWVKNAPAHRRFDLKVTGKVPPIAFDDPRLPVDGPTRCMCIRTAPAVWKWKPCLVWVGDKFDKKSLPQSRWASPKRFYGSVVPWTAAAHYEEYLLGAKQWKLLYDIHLLYDRVLICWCDDGNCHCHASVLARYANAIGSGAIHLPPHDNIWDLSAEDEDVSDVEDEANMTADDEPFSPD